MQRRAKSADQRHQETRGDADENGEDHQPQFAAAEHGPQPAGAQIVEEARHTGCTERLGRHAVPFQAASGCFDIDLETHLIISRFNIIRRFTHHRVIIERNMHMGQDRPSGCEFLDPAERLLQRKMAWVVTVLQRVDDEDIETRKLR